MPTEGGSLMRFSTSISRLRDGRVIKLDDEGELFVLEDGKWVPAPAGITLGAITESKPLSEAEIADLLPSETDPQYA